MESPGCGFGLVLIVCPVGVFGQSYRLLRAENEAALNSDARVYAVATALSQSLERAGFW